MNGSSLNRWSAVAKVAAAFCLCVAAALLWQRATAATSDPWKSPRLLALKKELLVAPKDERIKAEIRTLDLRYRQRYFRRLALDRLGPWMLIGGFAVFVFAAGRAVAERRKPPGIQPVEVVQPDSGQALRAVAGTGIITAVLLVVAGLSVQPAPPATVEALQKTLGGSGPAPVDPLPPMAEFQANWPRFRGPDGNGFSREANLPVAWDSKAGKGILWKTPVPAPGFNSPLIWGGRVFLSGGTVEKREVLCFDVTDGKLLWQRAIVNVPGAPAKVPEISEQTGYAASTMATDGLRVYAIFATGDLAALTLDGAPVWSKNLGTPKNQYGHATSLAIWQGRVLVQYDQGDAGPANSRLIAFDGATGRVVWEKARPVAASWATPVVAELAGKTQIVTLGNPWVIAYALADGAELWRAQLLEGEVTPSPIVVNGLVCAVSPSAKLYAIKPDGKGDVSQSAVAWTNDDSVPDVTSPASNGELVVHVNGAGFLTCVDAKTGKKVWDHDFGFEVQASPAIAGNRLYVIGASGTAVVAEAGRAYKELGQGTIEDKFYASPAFARGRIILRGTGSLWCVGGEGAR